MKFFAAIVLLAVLERQAVDGFFVSPSLIAPAHNTYTASQQWVSSNRVRKPCESRLLSGSVWLKLSDSSSSDSTIDISNLSSTDGTTLQALFNNKCDSDGLMTKKTLKIVPFIADLLEDEDLLSEELDEIWSAAPKFPEADVGAEAVEERVDVDGFMQIYRDIDDLFEEEEDDKEESTDKTVMEGEQKEEDTATSASAESGVVDLDSILEQKKNGAADLSSSDDVDVDDPVISRDEKELELAFATICDSSKLVSKEALQTWEEISQLLQDDLLGEDEFDALWERTAKSPGSNEGLIDVEGFLSLNVALDDLFIFEDDEEMEDSDDAVETSAASTPPVAGKRDQMVTGYDLSPEFLFSELANNDFLVGMEELKRWGELQELLTDGELLTLELQNMFNDIDKAPGAPDKITNDGFVQLYNAIDSLFEEDDDDEERPAASTPISQAKEAEAPPVVVSAKKDLLNYLSQLQRDPELLLCGLESSEKEQARVLEIVTALETEIERNLIISSGANMAQKDFAGTWDLVYTSSGMMKFNQGLSGLGGSVPNGKFGGLEQKLIATKYITDVEYTEHIAVTPEASSFDVSITGDWDLKRSVSLLTGQPTIIMSIEPDMVKYGPTSTRADHWKSVRAMNLLDVTYLDDDGLRIMRGNTSTDTLFIFQRK